MSSPAHDALDVLDGIEDALGRAERLAYDHKPEWVGLFQGAETDLATVRERLDTLTAQVEQLREERDAWQRHAGTSDREVADLRLALTTIIGALDLEPVVPQLLAVDGANSILRRIEVIVDEADRGFRERDAAREERDERMTKASGRALIHDSHRWELAYRQARDELAAQTEAGVNYLVRAESAEAENARLTALLETTREGLRELSGTNWTGIAELEEMSSWVRSKARALLAASSPPPGDTEGEQA